MGWTFDSIRSFPGNLRTESVWATSGGGEGRITLSNQYFHEMIIDAAGRTTWEEIRIRTAGRRRHEENIAFRRDPSTSSKPWISCRNRGRRTRSGRPGTPWPDCSKGRPDDELLTLTRTVVVLKSRAVPEEEHDQKSFLSVLNVFGFNPRPAGPSDLTRELLADVDLLVVPFPAASVLGQREIAAVIEFAAGGGLLITDGETDLARGLGIRFEERTVPVTGVKDLSLPARNLTWNPPVDVHPFATDVAAILAEDAVDRRPTWPSSSRSGRARFSFSGPFSIPGRISDSAAFPISLSI